VVIAQAYSSHAYKLLTFCHRAVTLVGVSLSITVPSPSCHSILSHQHLTLLDGVNAQAKAYHSAIGAVGRLGLNMVRDLAIELVPTLTDPKSIELIALDGVIMIVVQLPPLDTQTVLIPTFSHEVGTIVHVPDSTVLVPIAVPLALVNTTVAPLLLPVPDMMGCV
jgi:hypothetical protein